MPLTKRMHACAHAGMYLHHNHTSLPIRSDQPCYTSEPLLHAGSSLAEQQEVAEPGAETEPNGQS